MNINVLLIEYIPGWGGGLLILNRCGPDNLLRDISYCRVIVGNPVVTSVPELRNRLISLKREQQQHTTKGHEVCCFMWRNCFQDTHR